MIQNSNNEIIEEIVENFSYDRPSESVYKIIGKDSNILKEIEEKLDDNWLILNVDSNKDMLDQTNIFLKSKFNNEIGGKYFDIGIEIEKMLKKAQERKNKIFIGIDNIHKSKEAIVFISELNKWIRNAYPVYTVFVGTKENFKKLYNDKNIQFFIRGTAFYNFNPDKSTSTK